MGKLAQALSVGALSLVSACAERRPEVQRDLIDTASFSEQVTKLTHRSLPHFDSRAKARARLGRQLFFDKRLSKNGDTACATCHAPERSFTDGAATPLGRTAIARNTPTLVNAFADTWFFWDGRADSLAAQARGPLESAAEHGLSRGELIRLVRSHHLAAYEEAFGAMPRDLGPATQKRNSISEVPSVERGLVERIVATLPREKHRELQMEARRAKTPVFRVFAQSHLSRDIRVPGPDDAFFYFPPHLPTPVSSGERIASNILSAIAEFERTIVANDSPFDRFAARLAATSGDASSVLSDDFEEQELEGLRLFVGTGRCVLCHAGPNLSDQQFHNIGLEEAGYAMELGRSLGIRQARRDQFNCLAGALPRTESESCRELAWLDENSLQAIGAFKTPTLRNIAETAPYGHDGRFASIREVLDHYNLLTSRAVAGHRDETLKPLNFSAEELETLETFLRSLTSPVRMLAID